MLYTCLFLVYIYLCILWSRWLEERSMPQRRIPHLWAEGGKHLILDIKKDLDVKCILDMCKYCNAILFQRVAGWLKGGGCVCTVEQVWYWWKSCYVQSGILVERSLTARQEFCGTSEQQQRPDCARKGAQLLFFCWTISTWNNLRCIFLLQTLNGSNSLYFILLMIPWMREMIGYRRGS